MDTSQFFCPNEECPDYGVRGKGNIVRNRRYGKQRTQLLNAKPVGNPSLKTATLLSSICTLPRKRW